LILYSTCVQNLAIRFSPSGDMTAGVEIKNGSCDPDQVSFKDGFHPKDRT